jgi:threonylcarbamoyladenosine tRNA methylthiotransferase MtaB
MDIPKKSVYFHTLGCKLNQCESEELRQQFREHGYQPVDNPSQAGIIFISTCAVTTRAEQKSRQVIGNILRINPQAKIVAAGCAVQRYPEAFKKITGVSLLLGTAERMNPFPILEKDVRSSISDINPETISLAAGAPEHRTRAFLKIQDGCSSTCTYCIVPQARGSSRSIPSSDILKAVKRLSECGFQEIVLSGVNIGDYGWGLEGWNLLKLLDEVGNIGLNCRIRLSSLEPWTITPELIESVISTDWICTHFHIPFQSGSAKILKKMGRPYNRNDLEAIFDIISKHQAVGLGGDVIVGFPGEEDADFKDTIEFIEKYPFSYLHIFPFSRRPGTKAYDFLQQNHSGEITRRAKVLRELGERKKTDFLSSLKDTVQAVIFERKLHNGYRHGVSNNYVKVRSKETGIQPGKIYSVKITDIDSRPITGVIVRSNGMV